MEKVRGIFKRSWEVVKPKEVRLDKKDRRILSILNMRARIPFSELAREVGLSRDAVKYRVQRLMKEGVIAGFYTVMNMHKLGYYLHHVLLSLTRLTPERERALIDYLYSSEYVVYFVNEAGKWDYFVELYAKNPAHLNVFLKDLRERFADIIRDYEVLTGLTDYKWEQWPWTE